MKPDDPREDAALVAAALGNGFEAFAAIVERYKDALFGVALARLGNLHDAEDVAQQVFIEAFERLDHLRDPQRLGAWLRSMTVHRSIDLVRRRGKTVAMEGVAEPVAPQLTPQAELEQRELHERVWRALNQLPHAQRETLTLFYLGEHSRQQIAAMQEVPEETVKSRLRLAREKLKEELVDMVEEDLKTQTPRRDFAQRVFDLLNLYPGQRCPSDWERVIGELRRIGLPGIEGFIRAFAQPHARTRSWVMIMLEQVEPDEVVIELLKKGLKDSNKKVRRSAATALLSLDVPYERKRREFLPLIAELLTDPSRNVRRVLSLPWILGDCRGDFPPERLAVAIRKESDPQLRSRWQDLLTYTAEALGKG